MFKFIRKNAGLIALAVALINLFYTWYVNQASLNSDITQAAAISAELRELGLEDANISGKYTPSGIGDGLFSLAAGLFGWVFDNKFAALVTVLFLIFGMKPFVGWVRTRIQTRRRNQEIAQRRRERQSGDDDANEGSDAPSASGTRQQTPPQRPQDDSRRVNTPQRPPRAPRPVRQATPPSGQGPYDWSTDEG